MHSHVQQYLIDNHLAFPDGKIAFKSSLTKERRLALDIIKNEYDIHEKSASIAIYLLWNGINELPKCSCGSGKPVTWPKLVSCSVKCARTKVLSQELIWQPEINEINLTVPELLDKYELYGTKKGLNTLQLSVLHSLSREASIDLTKEYQPRHLVELLRSGQSQYPLCTCGSGIEVIPQGKRTTSCSNNCSAAIQKRVISIKNTVQEKYGVQNIWQRPEIVKQIQDKNRIRYAKEIWPSRIVSFKTEDNMEILDTEWIDGDYKYNFKCSQGHETRSYISDGRRPKCGVCFPRSSKPQREIEQFIQDLGFDINPNDRSIIAPLELDIVIAEKRLAIEVNGVYFHDDIAVKPGYHQQKFLAASNAGYSLVQITDAEWFGKTLLVKNRLKTLLGIHDTRIYARSCELVTLASNEVMAFCEQYHLQGAVRSNVQFGLKFNGELVMIASAGPIRFSKTPGIELLRLCSKHGVMVVGGASRLIKAIKNTSDEPLLSYCDLRYSTGNVYRQLGFVEQHITPPGYFYVHLKTGQQISRMRAMKHRLPKLLGNTYDSSLTERENMYANGYWRIEDAGHLLFKLT